MTVHRTGIFQDTGGTQYQLWAGVLRNVQGNWHILGPAQGSQNASGWYPSDDHQSSNLWTSQQDDSAVFVTGPSFSKVVSIDVTPDGLLAQTGTVVHATVVSGLLTLQFSHMVNGVSTALDPADDLLITDGDISVTGWFLV